MRLWAEVFSATDVALGIVNLAGLSITTKLDAAGDFTFEVAATDQNAARILAVRRRVKFYGEVNGERRALGDGVLLSQTVTARASGPAATWKGIDLLDELRRVNTLRGRVYIGQPVNDIIDDLIAEASGWVAYYASGLGDDTCRFDGQTILAAILSLVKRKGLHLRLGPGAAPRRIQIGTFGAAATVKAVQAAAWSPDLVASPDVALIENLQVVTDGTDIINWLEPVIGSGDAVYTLRRSTRTSPYAIQTTTGPDGRTIYYLSDAASIAAYGQSQAVRDMRDPVPLEAVSTTLVGVANALYDWAANVLARAATPHRVYKVSLKNASPVTVGDKARLIFEGYAPLQNGEVTYLSINEDVWVIRVTQKWGKDGLSTDWEVSTSDVLPESPAEAVARMMREQNTSALTVRFVASAQQYTVTGTLGVGLPLTVTYTTKDTVLDVGRCTITVTRPDATATAPSVVTFVLDGVPLGIAPVFWGTSDLEATVDFDAFIPVTGITGSHTLSAYCVNGSAAGVTLKVTITEVSASAN